MSDDRTLANSSLCPPLAAVAAAARAEGRLLRLIVATGATLQVRISHIGTDYVAGDLETAEGAVAIIPGASIVVVESEGPVGTGGHDTTRPMARSSFRALLTNSQRLSHRVIVHTAVGRHSGVIESVSLDAVVLGASSGSKRLVFIRHIVWVAVLGT